jgi:hypothetical protein
MHGQALVLLLPAATALLLLNALAAVDAASMHQNEFIQTFSTEIGCL